jgi:hypothetical protein
MNLKFIKSTNLDATSTALESFELTFWFKALCTFPASKVKTLVGERSRKLERGTRSDGERDKEREKEGVMEERE